MIKECKHFDKFRIFESRIFRSRIFYRCILVSHFPVLHVAVPHFRCPVSASHRMQRLLTHRVRVDRMDACGPA